MGVFYFIFVCILLLGFIEKLSNKRNTRLSICLFLFFLLTFVMGFRAIDYAGVDTIVYVSDFERITEFNLSYSQIFTEFYKDYFFYLAAKTFTLFCTDANIWLLFCSSIYIGSVSWLIYKYSPSVWLSYLLFVGWDFYVYNFQLVRHTWSLAFVIVSFVFILDRNIKKYAISMLLAITSQITSFISLVSYFIVGIRVKKMVKLLPMLVLALVFIISLGRNVVMKWMFTFSFLAGDDRLSAFNGAKGGQMSNFIISLVFLVFSSYEVMKHQNAMNSKELMLANTTLKITVFGVVFFSLQFVIAEFYRVAQYFAIFNVILLPVALKLENNKFIRNTLYLLVVAYMIKHFFGGVIGSPFYDPYIFYWE